MNRSGLHPVPAAHPRAAGDGTATVAYTERGLVSAEDFGRRVAALAGALAPRAERRWALACDDTLAFAVGLKALLLTGRNPVLPHA
ncbi:MAG TPA: AMP-dependent synthetase, partial [Gammaproteobacteria bacterium]|nr:AMP-dependent synthetase [Gammaproteobacteria bacterium]